MDNKGFKMAVHEVEICNKLLEAFERAESSEMSRDDINKCINQLSRDLLSVKSQQSQNRSILSSLKWLLWFCIYRLIPLGLLVIFTFQQLYLLYSSDPCLMAQPVLHDFATPIVNCTRCQHIRGPVVIHNISQIEFIKKYSNSLQPLLMKGAASNWPAVSVFSYEFFKDLYVRNPEAIDYDATQGQFFPYSSGIHTLDEFMRLDDETASLQGQKWYIGWSTTEPFIGEELRKHIRTPYFLHPKSSDDNLAWIFMGAPGPGASLHVDWVGRLSWQAQLSGRKTWTLAPPPECEETCIMFNVTVEHGDIIVLDTNAWYHATYIHPGNISITYGAEFE